MEQVITEIAVQKRDKERVNVYLDGQFAFGVARILAAGLQVGDRLTDQQIDDYRSKDEYEAAFQRAVTFIAYKPRTNQEVRAKMSKLEFTPEVIEATLERLAADGLLNDQQFAENWVEQRSAFKPRGKRLIRQELRRKGLDATSIEDAVARMPDEYDLAALAAEKYVRRLAGLDWQRFHDRLSGYLLRRGFDYSTVKNIVSNAWQQNKMNKKE